MKTLHVHVSVRDLAAARDFYTSLFGAAPTVSKSDYAKWLLEDPRVNFAVSAGPPDAAGISHLGIQVEAREALSELGGRLSAAGRALHEEPEATCCYAISDKRWARDPDGIPWEMFYTHGQSEQYGSRSTLQPAAQAESGKGCGCATAKN